MWYINALITFFAWGSADIFYKKSSAPQDKYSHLKIVIAVGTVMGLHAVLYMAFKGISFNPFQMIRYFPVSFMYILSMTLGYVGLRYVALSVSSPVQNTSGVLTAILCFIFFTYELSTTTIIGIILVLIGITAMAFLEKDNEIISKGKKTGILAISFPILYAIIDDLGTFADAYYLDEGNLISEDNALLAYEFTFFLCAVIIYIYLTAVKKEKFSFIREPNTVIAAAFETAGQYFYVFALADNAIVAAPMISAYSIVSVVFSRIFLKEKLSAAKYCVVAIVMCGIILLAI